MTWSQQKAFFGLIVVVLAYAQVSAWDEKDFAELRASADAAKANGVRYLVEQSGYRDAYVSDFHCRAPLKGERLVMQLAQPRDAGKGYRCTYWVTAELDKPRATVTWSRSPDFVLDLGVGAQP